MFKKFNKKALGIAAVIIAVFVVIFLSQNADVYENQKGMIMNDSVAGMAEMSMTNSLAVAPMAVRSKMAYGDEAYYEEVEMDGGMMEQSIGQAERKLEKRVSLNLVLENKESFVSKLKELTEFYNGYWQGFYDNNYEYNPTISIEIKIPVDQLEHFLAEVKGQADFIESENLTVNDVTLEYVDLKSRLGNAKQEEEQYLEVLDKAYKIEDILKVTQYLNQVRERIESMQGQMNYLMNRTDFAVVSIYARILKQGEEVEDTWSIGQTWKEAVNDLIQNTKYFAEDTVYWLVTNVLGIVFWGFIALIAYIIYRKKFKK